MQDSKRVKKALEKAVEKAKEAKDAIRDIQDAREAAEAVERAIKRAFDSEGDEAIEALLGLGEAMRLVKPEWLPTGVAPFLEAYADGIAAAAEALERIPLTVYDRALDRAYDETNGDLEKAVEAVDRIVPDAPEADRRRAVRRIRTREEHERLEQEGHRRARWYDWKWWPWNWGIWEWFSFVGAGMPQLSPDEGASAGRFALLGVVGAAWVALLVGTVTGVCSRSLSGDGVAPLLEDPARPRFLEGPPPEVGEGTALGFSFAGSEFGPSPERKSAVFAAPLVLDAPGEPPSTLGSGTSGVALEVVSPPRRFPLVPNLMPDVAGGHDALPPSVVDEGSGRLPTVYVPEWESPPRLVTCGPLVCRDFVEPRGPSRPGPADSPLLPCGTPGAGCGCEGTGPECGRTEVAGPSCGATADEPCGTQPPQHQPSPEEPSGGGESVGGEGGPLPELDGSDQPAGALPQTPVDLGDHGAGAESPTDSRGYTEDVDGECGLGPSDESGYAGLVS